MNAVRRFGFILLAMIMLLGPSGLVQAQGSDDVQYFPETGHNIKGEFLRFYKQTTNPELIFGYPITEEFKSVDGKLVQYFQRARFELGAGILGKRPVHLTPLGKVTYQPDSPRLNIDNPTACKSFKTSFPVCFAFLDFYEANGGESQFGKPISPFEFRENLIVQYFEETRFEWRADRPEGQRVALTDLGRIYFDQLGEDQTRLAPLRPLDATISSILSLHARAFVTDPITQSSGQQTVYVIVQSQTIQPVSGATGKVTIHFSGQQTTDYYFTTNSAGLGGVVISFEDLKIGELVPIDVIVTYQGLSARTSTSFRVWY